MPSPAEVLIERLQRAFDELEPGTDPALRPSDRADFQANGALGLAKRLGRSPRDVAAEVVKLAELDDLCSEVAVSGPGFINLTLAPELLARSLGEMTATDRLGVPLAERPERIVVDYSAPNVAKEMHVGHLRTTLIGDAICRMLVDAGHHVVRENHIGDWGTPFGMLIEHLLDLGETEAVEELSVGDLTAFYQAARRSFDADPAFAERSRARVVALQSGDAETMRLWMLLVRESLSYFNEVYRKLGVLLTDEDVVGESFYNAMLPAVVADLANAGLLQESDGALCVFPPGFQRRDGEPLPLIVQKSDEGFGYAATDLAAIRDRVDRLGADRLLYVVGAPQAQHLEMCFAVARLAGWLPESVEASHVAFGNVLGTDHKMLRTRSGDSWKLVDLLDEAVARAGALIAERTGESGVGAPPDPDLARVLGIGAVKYADLSTDRQRDYVFDFDRMLAFDGNTAPYLQYAHARICSLFRRAGEARGGRSEFAIAEPHERTLALRLLAFSDHVASAIAGYAPSRLCAYLHDLATAFTGFYENCPILRAEPAVRAQRLALADLTARTLERGLGLLGIEAPEQM